MPHVRRAARLAVLALFALSFIILGSVFLARWWPNAGHAGAPAAPVPSGARLISVREFDIALDGNVNSYRFSGTLYLASDLGVLVGSTQGHCAATEDLGDGVFVQLCLQAYNFSGAGAIPAGELTAAGRYIYAGDDAQILQWAITGGTGAYASAAGGLAFRAAADAPGAFDLTFNVTTVA